MVMAGGDICLLIPNFPMSFSEKICQMRRVRPVPRCLFGPPDPAENQRLFEEFLQKERERAKKRWGVDLDELEAAIAKASEKEDAPEDSNTSEEPRIPTVSAEIEDRLSSSGQWETEEKTSRDTSCPTASFKRLAICRKPCAKFQKRVRVGGLKRQTHLTDFWRSRKSVSFVFRKNKSHAVSLQSLKDLLELEPPVPKHD